MIRERSRTAPVRCVITVAATALSACTAQGDAVEVFTVGGDDGEVGVSIIEAGNGDLVIGGYSYDVATPREWDAMLLRVTDEGEIVWRWDSGLDGDDHAWSVRPAGDGFVLAGTQTTDRGDTDITLRRFNADGEVQWTRAFGGEGEEVAWACEPMPGGGFAVLGQTSSEGAGGLDFSIVRVDDNGDTLWTGAYGGPETDRAFNMAHVEDGGLILVGFTGAQHETMDAMAVRIDADGNEIWTKRLGGAGFDVAHGIVPDPAGGYIVSGYSSSLGASDQDAFLAHLDANGRISWIKTGGTPATDRALHVVAEPQGGFALVGYSNLTTNPDWDLTIHRFDAAGNHRTIIRWGGAAPEIGRDVIVGRDGSIIATGATRSENPPNDDVVVLRLRDPDDQ